MQANDGLTLRLELHDGGRVEKAATDFWRVVSGTYCICLFHTPHQNQCEET